MNITNNNIKNARHQHEISCMLKNIYVDENITTKINNCNISQILHVAKCNIEKSNFNMIIDILHLLQNCNDDILNDLIFEYQFTNDIDIYHDESIIEKIDTILYAICNRILRIAK